MTAAFQQNEMITAATAADEASRWRFAALEPDSEIAEAMRVNLAGSEDLNPSLLERVPMPTGGSTMWSFERHGEPRSCAELIGVPVYFGVRRTIWGSLEPSGKGPVLIGSDTEKMYRVSDDLGDLDPAVLEAARIGDRVYSCRELAYCQWGSGRNGKGRRMKDSRIICLLQADDAWPLLIQVGAMSVDPVSNFFQTLPAAYYQCVVSLGLERAQNGNGQPYARVRPKLAGKLTREQGRTLAETYTAALTRMLQVTPQRAGGRDHADDMTPF